ncbi:hypothetical protein LTR36_010472 [Oleoguttula mirabilis]|uniref:DNA replication factor Cdt1 C-terminal domain-containing protein n=1 Tax=Oleoguttula mirabilis TaxID=1507867 RepID=A0AAV9J4U3_9PEZI|nr:hypothetical protein LTR36_010472 [Oleoguttula mirabilis]
MAISRKRKHASADDGNASKQTSSILTQKNIKVFAAVSKAVVPLDDGVKTKKRKMGREEVGDAQDKANEVPSPSVSAAKMKPTRAGKLQVAESLVHEHEHETAERAAPQAATKDDKKRKRKTVDRVPEESDEETIDTQPKAGDSIFKQFAKKPTSGTPRTKRFKSALPPSPMETPSKRAAALFSNLQLDVAAQPIPFSLTNKQQVGIDTPPLTPDAEEAAQSVSFVGEDMALPDDLQDLARLHSAFLSALSMHYAHNGTASPVYTQALLPQITKTWKKRSVTLEDLRRVLALSSQPASFILEDYGRGGVCLSRAQPRGRAIKRAASYIDEEELNQCFADALQQQWNASQKAAESNTSHEDAAAFIAHLPLAPVTVHSSAEKAAPLFARGAQRLADIKSAQSASQQASTAPATATTTAQKTTSAVASRGTSLLDRILAKQALTSTTASGPTKVELERRAALHRCEDIARVLSLLAGAKSRCSFSMATVVQHLQQSLRNPITREEVERCLAVMAGEVTPGFVGVVVSGGVKAVVITRALGVGREEVRERVGRALGATV